MALVYHGKIPVITKEVSEIRETVNQRYVEIFGKTRAEQLAQVTARVLTPNSFFNTPSELERSLGEKLQEGASNKMLFLTNTGYEIDPSGKIKDKKVQTSAAFYIAEEAFHHSGSSDFTPRQVASYIHEYDHFVWFALQRVPIYLVNAYLAAAQEPAPKKPRGELIDYFKELIEADVPPDLISRNIYLAMLERNMIEHFEKANRILDKIVLESIGIEVSLEWRGKDKRRYLLPLPTGVMGVGEGGDPFKGLKDEQVIELFLNWENTLGGIVGSSYLSNLMAGIKELKISRVSIDQIKEDYQRRKQRKNKK